MLEDYGYNKPTIPQLLTIHEVQENSERRRGNAKNCE